MRVANNAQHLPRLLPAPSAKSCGQCNESVTTRCLGVVGCSVFIELKQSADSTPCDYFDPKAIHASRNR